MGRFISTILILVTCILSCGPHPAFAEDSDKILTAYTYARRPFAYQENGVATGFYPELFNEIAQNAGFKYQLYFAPSIKDLYEYAQTGKADFVFCGISQNPAYLNKMDFSYSVNNTGLQIMVAKNNEAPLEAVISTGINIIFSRFTLYVILFVIFVALLAGHVIWFFERKKEGSGFSKHYFTGVLKGLWWAVETITSVGYGESQLKSRWSKAFGVLFMIIGTCLFAVVVSVVTTKLTLRHIQNNISGPGDLMAKNVGLVQGSPFEDYAQSLGCKINIYQTLPLAAKALAQRKIDCVLDDSESIRWFALSHPGNNFELVGPVFKRRFYAIGLPQNSPWLAKINQAILQIRSNDQYDHLYSKWFGSLY